MFLEFANSDVFDLADFYHAMSIKNLMTPYIVTERFYEIGSIQGIEDTTKFFGEDEEG